MAPTLSCQLQSSRWEFGDSHGAGCCYVVGHGTERHAGEEVLPVFDPCPSFIGDKEAVAD
jgi:hypothetical protein